MLLWLVDKIVRVSNPEVLDSRKSVDDKCTLRAKAYLKERRRKNLVPARVNGCIVLRETAAEGEEVAYERVGAWCCWNFGDGWDLGLCC